MRAPFPCRWSVTGLALGLLASCGAPVQSSLDGAPTPQDGAAPAQLVLFGDLVEAGTLVPLAEVAVCVVGSSGDCARSDASGFFRLDVPRDSELQISVAADHPALAHHVFHVRTRDVSDYLPRWDLARTAALRAALDAGGLSWDEERSAIVAIDFWRCPVLESIGVCGFGHSEAAVSLLTGAAVRAYVARDGTFDAALSTTTDQGRALLVGVSEGEHRVRFDHAHDPCASEATSWPVADADDQLRFRAIAGAFVHVGWVRCVPLE